MDISVVGYKDEPFTLESQAHQVFYVTNHADEKCSILFLTNEINGH